MVNRYYFSEDNRESLPDAMEKTFSENQLKEVYRDIIEKQSIKIFRNGFWHAQKWLNYSQTNEREEMKMKNML